MILLQFKQYLTLFKHDTKGVIATLTAIMIFPIMLVTVGAGIDLGVVLHTRYEMQTSLDAALIASSQNEEDRQNNIQNRFKLNLSEKILKQDPQLLIAESPDDVIATATVKMPTILGKLTGSGKTNVAVSAKLTFMSSAEEDSRNEDIVLVVDASTSVILHTHKIRPELEKFVDKAMDFGDNTADEIRIGTVFYGNTIRLPSTVTKNTSWVDTYAQAPLHYTNFASAINRFTLFQNVNKVWDGCVEVRQHPYDVHDYDPTDTEMTANERQLRVSRNARFFVPWFEPDQMDEHNGNMRYASHTSYIQDSAADESDKTFQFKLPINLKNHTMSTDDQRWFKHQANTTKYLKYSMDARTSNITFQSHRGPTGTCDYKFRSPITTLNHNYKYVRNTVSKYKGQTGNPNMLQAFTWGWRVISPQEPFTSQDGVSKTMILVTSGYNSDVSFLDSTPNLGRHTAFGLPYENRLNVSGNIFNMSPQDHMDARNKKMDERFLQACEHAKRDGVTIYVMSLKRLFIPLERQDIMQTCASSKDHYYNIKIEDFSTIFGDMYARKARFGSLVK